ncbi:DUF2141 domain-containing protein [Cellulophaga sp. E16_2]|uniref:DUF2141 domain-containing protein n=1 Tax=Cellulophaga sp. E16_2 TaxID=2789297 RepID=UPI001A920E83|nr:DUF2141 domain-containing protein [Cellulophaga sp. E16_2]MBO0591530.1 DUF2141 domain-containing protein [Cellulophaga sp. E16_2]
MNKILYALLFLPVMMWSQHTLKVNVQNVSNANGHIHIAVYNSSDGFLAFDQVYTSKTGVAVHGTTVIVIDDILEGTYALAVFHDENSNEKLDTNFLGIPKEHVGFSNSKMKTFGPPSFKECSFVLQGDKEIKVTIK